MKSPSDKAEAAFVGGDFGVMLADFGVPLVSIIGDALPDPAIKVPDIGLQVVSKLGDALPMTCAVTESLTLRRL